MKARVARGLEVIARPERVEALLWSQVLSDSRQKAREQLFNLYVPLARRIARRCAFGGRDKGLVRDAEQWAFEGLLQAIDAFDPLRGAPFAAYARKRIVGCVRDGVARSSEVDAQYSHRHRLERERLRSLKDTEGQQPKTDAIDALAEIAVGLAIGLMLEGTGLIASDGEADPRPTAYESVEWAQTRAHLASAVAKLTAAEATVIQQHYEHGLLFAQVAQLMGLSKGRVSQLHKSALSKLRKRLSRE